MTISNRSKALIALVGLICITTACADRVRENCDTTKADGTLERKCP